MQEDFLRDKFEEIEILKGKLLTYPKECGNDIILKLCMICNEIEEVLFKTKKKYTKSDKEKGKGICPLKEKYEKTKSKDKHKKSTRGTEYVWSREMLKDLN